MPSAAPDTVPLPSLTPPWGIWEEYRYDPLGPRTMVTTRRGPNLCDVDASTCISGTTRFVWPGDQILWELKEADGSYSDARGQVSYFHAGGIDRPMTIWKAGVGSIVPHQNWRGQFARGTFAANGAPSDCQTYPPSGCIPIRWPGWSSTAWHEDAGQQPVTGYEHYWFGSLSVGMRDASGLMYMRNRYYDPQTGQFTQTDPIGLAGGMNAYGFAAGDPVTYSDPYGLKADSIPAAFRSKLGNMCQEVDCDKAQIHVVGWMPANKAMTLGNHMFFGRRLNPNRVGDVALVAHELPHVGAFQKQPSFLSALEVAATFPLGATPGGLSPYNWKQYPLGSWQEYNLESRAQIVQDCFSLGSGSLACEISPCRPPNYDPSVYVPGNP